MKNQKKRAKERRIKLLVDILTGNENKSTDEIMDVNVNQFAEIHVVPALAKLPKIVKQFYLFFFSIELFALGLLIGA